jgi:glyoxylase-like metal-dependent hydrolase (beta-lactamase superfamily II)
MLKIICIVNGELEENCYIIHNKKKALIIDPGSEEDKIYKVIDEYKLEVVGILVTHYHFDHVLCLDQVRNKYNVEVIDYKNKKEKIDCFNFEIIENFGHTMDSVSFYFKKEKLMFTGDFVFKDSIGKYDYFNENIMLKSLKSFCKLDDDIIIYPGHGEQSTVGYEKRYNYFLRGI